MKAEDLQIRQRIIEAGFGDRTLGCRGSLYEALFLMIKQDPERNDDFVNQARETLSALDGQERHSELLLIWRQHSGIKACHECGMKPDDIPHSGQVFIVCMNHDGYAVVRSGSSLSEAVGNWNNDEWVPPGIVRRIYAFR